MAPVPARWLLGVLLVAVVAGGCARTKARRVMRANEARQEHEILCGEGLARCADAISRYCKNRYSARAFTVVREEPERGVVVVVCEPR
jgi:hypothetical protein